MAITIEIEPDQGEKPDDQKDIKITKTGVISEETTNIRHELQELTTMQAQIEDMIDQHNTRIDKIESAATQLSLQVTLPAKLQATEI